MSIVASVAVALALNAVGKLKQISIQKMEHRQLRIEENAKKYLCC